MERADPVRLRQCRGRMEEHAVPHPHRQERLGFPACELIDLVVLLSVRGTFGDPVRDASDAEGDRLRQGTRLLQFRQNAVPAQPDIAYL